MMTRPLPPILQQKGQQTAAALPAPADDAVIPALAISDFISDVLISHPAWLQDLAVQPSRPGEWQDYAGLLASRLTPKIMIRSALSAYGDELRQYLLRVPEEDEEQQLRIIVADIAGVLPVMQVSDHLMYLAEAIHAVI